MGEKAHFGYVIQTIPDIMTVYNKGLLNAAPQSWKFWGTSMWAGMGRIRGVRKGHGGIWSSEVRSGGKTAEEVA